MAISKKIILIFILILSTLVGCVNNQDIDERSIILGIGLDKPKDNQVSVTIQTVKISNAIKGNSGGGSDDSQVWVNTSKGATVFEAIRNQLSSVNRKPFFGHIRLIVIGEELAKEGIVEVINFFERDHEIRLTPNILISKGIDAKSILEATSNLEKFPITHLESIIHNNSSNAKIKKTLLIDLLRTMNRPGHDPVLGIVQPNEGVRRDNITIKDLSVMGGAILKEQKLIGWLNPTETRGLNFIDNSVENTVINVDDPIVKGKKVAIEVTSSKGKKSVSIIDNKLTFIIDIKSKGSIGDQQSTMDLTSTSNLKILKEKAEVKIKKDIIDVMNLAKKKYKSDFLGFSKLLDKKYPEYWKAIEGNWEETFSQADIKVNVDFEINRTGLISSPTSPK